MYVFIFKNYNFWRWHWQLYRVKIWDDTDQNCPYFLMQYLYFSGFPPADRSPTQTQHYIIIIIVEKIETVDGYWTDEMKKVMMMIDDDVM